jgi:hypothetical protein
MTAQPRLLRDLIDIPTAVHKGDLVYQLADAADDAGETVAHYVVTDQLREAFLDAVGLLRSAIEDGSSKAAFLHGSFGSGKSNFMGVLQLLLDDNPAARAVPELAPVVAKLDDWKGGRRFLTVPFHLIGESDLESAVFGQYVRHLERIRPDAPPPAVFADEPILENADDIRARVGDEAFFATLSSGSAGAESGWGDLDAAWDAVSYEHSWQAPHGSPDRTRLVQAILTTWLTGFAKAAHANKGGYASFEDGLSAISVHARGLGYDGVILFLDELILWFLSRLGDMAWVSKEASKLSELVEAASATRPVPIVSIIARQRDLRELVGEDVPGAEKLSFADQLDYQAGRFDTITLDDSNLPLVANRRLLTPVNDAAKAEFDVGFASLSLSPRVHDVLLAEKGNDEAFRLTYPFSPAFMTVLVDVAGALQRTRTGLRVLLELLVDRRDVLEVGQLVPVGDLYNVIDVSDDPFSDAMRASFDRARKLYKERLRPTLLAEHNLGTGDDPTTAFVNDDRLVKTLLLAALVPESIPFKNLTVERLVALNHGTIASPIPGQETAIATNKLRRLSGHVGELSLGSDPNNPTVAVRLSGVDTDSILASADGVDNTAMRRTLVRQLVLSALGLPSDQLQSTYTLVWNGLRRDVTVVFGNVRDTANLPDATFGNDGPNWKLIMDFPFDDMAHGPLDDLERLDRLREGAASWSTLCWLPSHFTPATLDVLGRLVRLNHVLASDQRFNEATAMLSPADRAAAKPVLETMRSATGNQINTALLGAYGVVTADEKVVDVAPNLSHHFQNLKAGLTIAPPTKASLRDALDQVLDQALRHTYPGAPDLGTEVKPGEVRKVAELCTDAVVEPDGRLVVKEPGDRKLLARIANPLQLGIQSEQAFKLATAADRWDNAFTKAINQDRQNGADTQTVGLLREAIDVPSPMGLTSQLQNLIILVWAQVTNHTFRLHGGPVAPTVDRLDDAWEVVPQALPSTEVWQRSHERMASIFGITLATKQRSGFAVERAGIELRRMVDAHGAAVSALVERVEAIGGRMGIDERAFPRLDSARAAQELLASLGAAPDDLTRVGALAASPIPTSELALGKSISSAQVIVAELNATQFSIIEAAMARPDGAHLRAELTQALSTDELVTALVPVLHRVQQEAVGIVAIIYPPLPKPPPPSYREWSGHGVEQARAQLETLQARIEAKELAPEFIEVKISWNEPDGEGKAE